MADGLNKVMLLGNIGADPELRFTQGGHAILKIRMATTESYLDKNRQRQERTEWHSVVIWGARAEGLSKILTKGARVFIEGSNHTSSYDDKDGVKRYKTEINAQNVILCGGGGGSSRPHDPAQQGENGQFSDADYGVAPSDDSNFPF